MEGDGNSVARGLVKTGSRGESFCNADRERLVIRRFRGRAYPTTQPMDAATLKEALYPLGLMNCRLSSTPARSRTGTTSTPLWTRRPCPPTFLRARYRWSGGAGRDAA
jgi:hypothetical protein